MELEMRKMCYGAAMARRWGVRADTFYDFQRGPRRLELGGRRFVVRPIELNGGVPTLLEIVLDFLDAAYEKLGDAVAPPVAVPTAWEHNGTLCVVKRRACA